MPSPFDRIYADVRKDVPSVPEAVLRQELFRVMDDFTQHTNIWQETVEFDVMPPNRSYVLTVMDGQPNRLLFVYDVNAPIPYWPASGITMRIPGTIQLYYLPSQAATWAAVLGKRTSDPVDPVSKYPVIDDWIVDKYADPIGRGVLARLQFQPQKPYSNPMLAQPNQRAYLSGRAEARINDSHTNVYNGQAWNYPQGWGTTAKKGLY
jgi:hypothetical protein